MRHVNVTGPAFQPTMQAVDNYERDLRDEVAKKMFGALVDEFQTSKSPELIAKTSFDYADEFMRERYERTCVKASMQSPSIPDHLGQLNL